MLHLEYVCTGNNGRSPMAQAIAQDYVHRQGLANKVVVSSSGSGLHESTKKQGTAAELERAFFISTALENGIFQEDWRKRLAAGGASEEERQDLFNYVVRVEGILRDRALWDKGLVAAGEYHKPTIALPPRNGDTRLIVAMAEKNVEQVRQIYEGFSFNPTITTVNQYAAMVGDVPNPFCQLLPAYEQARDHLLDVVPRTIDRAVEELLG